MSSESTSTRWAGVTRWLIPVGISLLAVWFVFHNFDAREVAASFGKITTPTLLLSTLLFLVGLGLRAWSWKIMLGSEFTYKNAFLGLNAGYLMNNVLPLRLGEFGRAILLSGSGPNRSSFGKVFAAVVSERVLDVFIAAVLVLSVLPFLVTAPTIRLVVLVTFFLTLILMAAAGAGSRNKEKILERLTRNGQATSGWRAKLVSALGHLLSGFDFFSQPSRWIPGFIILLASWACSIAQLHLLQSQVLRQAVWWWPVLVVSAGAFINALPSAPAGIGVFEAAVVGAYALVGVGQSPALVLAIIMHVTQFVLTGLFGLAALFVLGESLPALLRQSLRLKADKDGLQ